MSKKKLNVVNMVMDTEVTYMTCAFRGNKAKTHKGVDLIPKSTAETPYILAFADGEVIHVQNFSSSSDKGWGDIRDCGTYVAIRHEDGSITRYQHLKYNSLRVGVGSIVKKGQIIGLYGRPTTGFSTGCHLHFDISFPFRKDNVAIYASFYKEGRYYVDPLPYLDGTIDKPKTFKVLRDVNIRDKNTLNGSKVIGEYKKGEKVSVDSVIGSWLHTDKGWCNNNNNYFFKAV